MQDGISVLNRRIWLCGNEDAPYCVIQPVDKIFAKSLKKELEELEKRMPQAEVLLVGMEVTSWNDDLSPWKAPAVFGEQDFGGNAGETLHFVTDVLLPFLRGRQGEKMNVLAGYSLAGLFALWACAQTDCFLGMAAVSPSVWFPGWIDYAGEHLPKVQAAYLSLGNREEKTKNPVMAAVGDAVRQQNTLLEERGYRCALEWNAGNHFQECELRMAKGIAWVLGEISA